MRVRDGGQDPGDFDGGDFAEVKPPLTDVRAFGGVNPEGFDAEVLRREERTRQVVSLGDEQRGRDTKDDVGAVETVVSTETDIIENNIASRNPFGDGLFLHRPQRITPCSRLGVLSPTSLAKWVLFRVE